MIVRAFAPATVANVGCAFDTLGFAIAAPGDEVEVRFKNSPGVTIAAIHGEQGKLPLDPTKNTGGVAVLALLNHLRTKQGIEIELFKKMPLGSGLGSSAASAVAALFAANHALGEPLSREALLPFAMEAERIACGTAHADNVAPALLGGIILIRSYTPLDIIKLSSPDKLLCTVVHPHVVLRTEDARKILQQKVALRDAIVQWGNVAGLVAGLLRSDYNLIGRSLQDVIVEPVRSLLIPGFDNAKRAALEAGALGGSISGSGPALFALSIDEKVAHAVGMAMQREFSKINIKSDIHVSKINETGVRVL